jgi:hypothetical protein
MDIFNHHIKIKNMSRHNSQFQQDERNSFDRGVNLSLAAMPEKDSVEEIGKNLLGKIESKKKEISIPLKEEVLVSKVIASFRRKICMKSFTAMKKRFKYRY